MGQNELEIARLKESNEHDRKLRQLILTEYDQKLGWVMIPGIIIFIILAIFLGCTL